MLAEHEVSRRQGRYATGIPAGVRVRQSAGARDPFDAALALMGCRRSFTRGAEIFRQDEPVEYIYQLIEGAVMTSRLLNDGRRQVGGFHFPGDILGLEAGAAHRFSAEAIGKTTVIAVKFSVLGVIAHSDAAVARALWLHTARTLDRMHHLTMLLGRSNAQERVSCFLEDMAARLDSGSEVELPMSRKDIADYLGLTIETVSRTLSQMERDGSIEFLSSRKIRLCKGGAFLEAMS